jgi:Legionella pneumophila major outer membrane protein precursor
MVRLLFLLLFGTVAATGIEGSAIFWRATSGGIDYACQERGDVRRVDTIKPSYHWGFWVAGHLSAPTGCHALELYGLSIRGDDDLVAARLDEDYWTLRLRFVHTLCCGSASSLHLSAGARYGNLKTELWETDSGSQRFRYQGAGPEVGICADAKLWKELRFKGSLSTAALIGERCTEFFGGHETSLVPMLEARFGARAGRSLCWFCLEGELGWALDTYWGALRNLEGELAPFGFSGPYATIRGSF